MQTDAPEEIDTFAVDGDIIAYRCSAVCEDETPETAKEAVDEFLYNIVRETGIKHMIIFLSPEKNFRHTLAVTQPYKGNRKDIVHPKYREPNNEYLKSQYGAIITPNYEADDSIASFMTQSKYVAHAGIDKDIKQVHGWHYDFVKRIWEYTSKDESVLKLYRQVCTGDSTDYIPGLPGIGKVKAEKAITDPLTAKDNAIALYHSVMKAKSKKTEEERLRYFHEQYSLVALVDSLEISCDGIVTIVPPDVFPTDEEGWTGEEPKPKLKLI